MDFHLLAPTVLLSLTGKEPATGRTSLQCTFFPLHTICSWLHSHNASFLPREDSASTLLSLPSLFHPTPDEAPEESFLQYVPANGIFSASPFLQWHKPSDN